jgi:Tfp pilus assembly protein PilP
MGAAQTGAAPSATVPSATAPAPSPQARPANRSTAPAKPPGQGPASAPVPTGLSEGFAYHAEGRRDPFVSLVRRGSDEVTSSRSQGLGGLDVGDLSLRGIVATQGMFVAMVQAPDNRTYLVRQNDTLRDARVKAITADAVVFLQKVSDPLEVVKEREVRKPLRPNEEGK